MGLIVGGWWERGDVTRPIGVGPAKGQGRSWAEGDDVLLLCWFGLVSKGERINLLPLCENCKSLRNEAVA